MKKEAERNKWQQVDSLPDLRFLKKPFFPSHDCNSLIGAVLYSFELLIVTILICPAVDLMEVTVKVYLTCRFEGGGRERAAEAGEGAAGEQYGRQHGGCRGVLPGDVC